MNKRWHSRTVLVLVLVLSTLGGIAQLGRGAGAQPARVAVVVEDNLDRDALHDLGEVAGGVVGRSSENIGALEVGMG